jgi:hypothetical protein
LTAFFVLGLIFGVSYDFTNFFNIVFSSKFLFDFLMMIIWGLIFFSFLIGYNNGEIRWIFFADCCIGYILYTVTFRKIISKPSVKLATKINKKVNLSFKKLKISKKSFKKLLHFGK